MSGVENTVPFQFPAEGNEVDSQPFQIGRYRTERVLGRGGFGIVYLGHDDQLQRQVAIKVPHPRLVAKPEMSAVYLEEARTVANLDHPHIVTVYDVGATSDIPCYIVSQFINGIDLAKRLSQSRLSQLEACKLITRVADALHYAHRQGLVHRDVKPGNLLLDQHGAPYVSDFGLAMRESDFGAGPCFVGTLAYMSPEQARGEGHRVNARSDIFSLGVVFYELITGRRPFSCTSGEELREQIASREPRPPRQVEDSVPRELDRICLKALSLRATGALARELFVTTNVSWQCSCRHGLPVPDFDLARQNRMYTICVISYYRISGSAIQACPISPCPTISPGIGRNLHPQNRVVCGDTNHGRSAGPQESGVESLGQRGPQGNSRVYKTFGMSLPNVICSA